jgi:hypothetical protein
MRLLSLSCESAMPRITSATVWLPVLPPMLATIGISAASAASFSIEPFEHADHARGDERREQVEAEPDPALAPALPHRAEEVDVVAEAHLPQRLLEGIFGQPVDHLVDRKPAHDLAMDVDHRRRNEVVTLERLGRLVRVVVGREVDRVGVHRFRDFHARFAK